MGKRILEARKKVEKRPYGIKEAIELLKSLHSVKFDETVELHIKLGIDPKQTDQSVRGFVVLPNGSGRKIRVAVIAKGEKLKEALASGADYAGDIELVQKIQTGWLEFDKLVATPDAMKDLTKVAKILGPKGLMPNPKSGTVTFEIKKTVENIKKGMVEFKNDDYGIVHIPCGKLSFETDKLVENINAAIEAVKAQKPAKVKKDFIISVSISSTMGPGIKLKI